MDILIQDLKYGFRTLKNNPGFSIIAILALALGIAINTTIFTVVNAVLIQPLPYNDPDRIFILWEKQPQMESSVAYPNFLDWRSENRVFETMAAFRRTNMNLTGFKEPERLSVRMVSAEFLQTLGIQPAIGRDFRKDEDQSSAEPVVLLSNGLWKRRFGSDPKVLGSQLQMDDRSYTVIGITPDEFEFGSGADVYVPIGQFYFPEKWRRGNHPGIYVLGRLKNEVSVEQMKSAMQSLAASLAKQYPDTNAGSGITIQSLRDNVVGDIRPSLILLAGAVAFVLLIACANVANMMLARAAERTREIAIRASLGASRLRIIRQVLTESLVIASIASTVGLLLAYWGVDILLLFRPDNLPRLQEISLDRHALLFTIGLTAATSLLLGLIPAIRTASPDLNEALKDASAKQVGRRGQNRIRQALVVSEVALAIVLLIGAGLLARSFVSTQYVDPGFQPQNVLTLQLSLPEQKYDGKSGFAFLEQLEQRIAALPGIKNVGVSNGLPFAGASEGIVFVEGRPQPSITLAPQAVLYVATPGYFQTMGIQLVKGRFFNLQDNASSPVVTIIDEVLARTNFPGEEALGKRISMGEGAPFMEIIGIVKHVQHYGLDSAGPVQSQMYFPLLQVPEPFVSQVFSNLSLIVKTEGEPLSFVSSIRKQLLAVDPNQPVFNVQPMSQWLSDSLSARRFAMTLLSLFAGLALLLALFGMYGVMSYLVVQRTREIGIRVALGAAKSDILRMILKQGLLPVLIGTAIGLAGAFGISKLLAGLLFEVTPRDPVTFAAIPLILLLVTSIANYIPARRAVKVSPLTALRYE